METCDLAMVKSSGKPNEFARDVLLLAEVSKSISETGDSIVKSDVSAALVSMKKPDPDVWLLGLDPPV